MSNTLNTAVREDLSAIGTVWLIGAGAMAVDYAAVLSAMGIRPIVIGRSVQSATDFHGKTGIPVEVGGLEHFLSQQPDVPYAAIVATPVEVLAANTTALMQYGVRHILTEKPAGLNAPEIANVQEVAEQTRAAVYVAYNRRFYSAVEQAKAMIAEDGGLTSCHFEFTEWGHTIEGLPKPKEVFDAWLLANSSHVIDLAFHLAGEPVEMKSYAGGSLSWHSQGAVFTGSGKTDQNVLFSYCANWDAPGRWSLEAMTRNYRLIFRPMEQLHLWRKGTVAIEKVEIEDGLDLQFKPGLYRQTRAFLQNDLQQLCTIEEQSRMAHHYHQILTGA